MLARHARRRTAPPARPAPASAVPSGADTLENWQRAESTLARMTQHPRFGVEQWLALGAARHHLGDIPGMAEAAQRAYALEPDNLKVVHQLTTAYMRQNRFAEALPLFEAHATGEAREHYQFVSNHATTLAELRRHEEAVPIYLEAMVLCIRDPAIHMKLGLSLKEMKLFEEAAESFLTAVTLEPGRFAAQVMALHLRQYACAWRQYQHDKAQLVQTLSEIEIDPLSTKGEGAVWALTALDVPPPLFLKAARQVAVRCAVGAKPLPRRPMPAPGSRRIRVGYVSSDFYSHATTLLMVEALEKRDTSRFEVTLYSHSRDDNSQVQHRIRSACERFVDMNPMSAAEMAQRIHDDEIDILVDLKGQTFENRLGVFAFRPAPIQVAWLGFPGTCGADYMDYIIGDPQVTPLAHAAHYSEHIAQLPGCYQPNDSRRQRPEPHRRLQWGLPEDKIILGNFNQSFKLTPETFDAWARILHAVPDSLLWMLADNQQAMKNIEREAEARGLGKDRIRFAPRVGNDEHLARLPLMDFMLDNWPCNAHTTASDALWMGVPVLTLMGDSFAARVAGSLLHSVGLPELACTTLQQYEQTAIALMRDREALQAIRQHLIEGRDSFALFSGERFARDLEALYERMVERDRQGLPPGPLAA